MLETPEPAHDKTLSPRLRGIYFSLILPSLPNTGTLSKRRFTERSDAAPSAERRSMADAILTLLRRQKKRTKLKKKSINHFFRRRATACPRSGRTDAADTNRK